jgi:diacylglycerol kinase family enzyme
LHAEILEDSGRASSLAERWLAIINPRSGHRKSDSEISYIQSLLSDSLNDDIEFFVTRHMGDALSVSRKRRDVAGFLAVGGDGTLFDIINGMDLSSQKLALFPAGTGNGLARELEIYDVDKALQTLQKNECRNVDLIHVEAVDRGGQSRRWYVATTAALGYTADVVELANSSFKPLGPFCYPVTSIIQAMLSKPFRCRMRRDDQATRDITPTNILVNNSRYAGDFLAFPNALIDDGKADFVVARAGFFSQTAHNLSILSQSFLYETSPAFTANFAEFVLEEDRMLMLDGEIVPGIISASFSLKKGILSVVAP